MTRTGLSFAIALIIGISFSGPLASANNDVDEAQLLALSLPSPERFGSKSVAVYVGENTETTSVYVNGRKVGEESFDYRYGSQPKPLSSIAGDHAITEGFFLVHPKKTEMVYIYIHGITDSAFQGKDIARDLFNAGHNVYSMRLSGHGTDSSNINNIDLKDWRQDVDDAVAKAKGLGKKVFLVGLSTGAALAIDRAYRQPDGIEGVIAIAPAIGMKPIFARIFGKLGLLNPLSKIIPYIGQQKTTQLEVRQPRKGTRGVYQLYLLGRSIQALINAGKPMPVPTFMVTSSADEAIQENWVAKLLRLSKFNRWLRISATNKRLAEPPQEHFAEIVTETPPVHPGLPVSPNYLAHDFNPVAAQIEDGTRPMLDYVARDEQNIQFSAVTHEILRFSSYLRRENRCSILFSP